MRIRREVDEKVWDSEREFECPKMSSNSIELKSLPWCRDFKVFFRACDQCSQLTLILLDCIIITHGSHDNLHFIPHVSLQRGSLVNRHHLYTLPDMLRTNCSFQFWQDFSLNDQNMSLCSCISFIIYHFECMTPWLVRSCTLFKYCNAGMSRCQSLSTFTGWCLWFCRFERDWECS